MLVICPQLADDCEILCCRAYFKIMIIIMIMIIVIVIVIVTVIVIVIVIVQNTPAKIQQNLKAFR
jgi:hypothetical protein